MLSHAIVHLFSSLGGWNCHYTHYLGEKIEVQRHEVTCMMLGSYRTQKLSITLPLGFLISLGTTQVEWGPGKKMGLHAGLDLR